MPKEDYIESEVRKIAQFLIKAISRLVGLDKTAETKTTKEEIRADLKSIYKIELENLNEQSTEDFIASISKNPGFTYMNMELLADLIDLVAETEMHPISQQEYLSKSLAIYFHIDKMEKTYSMDRAQKIAKIKSRMN